MDGKFWALQPGGIPHFPGRKRGQDFTLSKRPRPMVICLKMGPGHSSKGLFCLDEFPDFYFLATLYWDNLRYNHLVRMICAKNISPTSYFRSFWINCLAKDLFKLTLLDKVAGNHEVFLGKEKEPGGSFVHPVPQNAHGFFLKTSPATSIRWKLPSNHQQVINLMISNSLKQTLILNLEIQDVLNWMTLDFGPPPSLTAI